jgi:hypothetical protein
VLRAALREMAQLRPAAAAQEKQELQQELAVAQDALAVERVQQEDALTAEQKMHAETAARLAEQEGVAAATAQAKQQLQQELAMAWGVLASEQAQQENTLTAERASTAAALASAAVASEQAASAARTALTAEQKRHAETAARLAGQEAAAAEAEAVQAAEARVERRAREVKSRTDLGMWVPRICSWAQKYSPHEFTMQNTAWALGITFFGANRERII